MRTCTQPPWEVAFGDKDDEGFIKSAGIYTKDGAAQIAEVLTETLEADSVEEWNATIEGDTRLMAAAPDLLQAARALVALIDSVPIDPRLGGETDRVFPHYEFDELRAAIAKATLPIGWRQVET